MKDISNQKFGKLTALKIHENKTPKHKTIWLCQCDCGNEVKIQYSSLTNKRPINKSCGCHKFDKYIGKTFGELTVNSYILNKDKEHKFICTCSCGNTKIDVSYSWLKRKKYCNDCSKKEFIKKHGTKTGFSDPRVQKKIKQTILQKYGVDNVSQIEHIKSTKRDKFRDKYKGKMLKEWAEILNKQGSTFGQQVKKYGFEQALKINH